MKGICRFCSRSVLHRLIEAGCSRKAPFVIRTKDQWEMFQKSLCTSLSVRVIQREVTFQKGSVNIVLRQNSPSLPKTDDPQPSTSSQIQLQQESAKSKTSTCITLGFFPNSASGNGIWALGSGISKMVNGTGTPPPPPFRTLSKLGLLLSLLEADKILPIRSLLIYFLFL